MSAVKQERHDDAEIAEMAAKIVESHKATKQSTTPGNSRGNISTILGFIKSNGKGKEVPSQQQQLATAEKAVLDERSQKGQFGWTTLGKVHIPYIFRGVDDKYCAVRMVEMKLLDKYLSFLHQDIYNCTCIRSYYITEAEARLLNDINFVHCDSHFGRDRFSGEDLIVRLSDAIEFYNFLDACYSKLLKGSSNPLDRCGFIRINKESVVPYTIYQGVKFVPLFYFEGETDNLKLRANKLEGWDLSYLKFCCKVQGIRNELFAHDSCSVISLNDIRNYFPPGTTFEDYWPQKMLDTQYLITNKNTSQTAVGQWTRQPVGPPISSVQMSTTAKTVVPLVAVQPKTPTPTPPVQPMQQHQQQLPQLYNNYANPMGTQHAYSTPTTVATQAVSRNTYGSSSVSRQPRTYIMGATVPPPLVRSAAGYPGYAKEDWPAAAYTQNTQTTIPSNYLLMNENYGRQQHQQQQQQQQQQAAQIRKYPPPPLIPVRQMNGGMRFENTTGQNLYQPAPSSDRADLSANNHQIINQQPAHQQPTRPQPPSSTQDDRTNGRITKAHSHRKQTITQLPDAPVSSLSGYKISKAIIEGKVVSSINMKPFVYTELLVTIQDLVNFFFNNVPVHSCQQVMQVLGIELYKGNAGQMQVLVECGKCQSLSDICPLVQVRNVIDYMPQLKYMLGGMADIVPKRS